MLCTDATPNFLGYFDLSVAPPLLYYAYIPIIVVSIFLSLYVLIEDNFSLRSKLLFSISFSFVAWVINIIFQWVAVYANDQMFSWQITSIIEIFISISVLLFYYTYIYRKEVPNKIKYFSFFAISLVAMLVPSSFNMSSFDINQCEAAVGPLLYIINIFEIIVGVWVIILAVKDSFQLADKPEFKKQSLILAFGSALFLIIFSLSNMFGQATTIYQFNLFGPIGMVLFLAFLTFMIVRYKAFNIKLIAAKALVVGIFALIASQFAFIQNDINRILTAITLMLITVFGWSLVKSVQKEIEQREELAESAVALKESHEREMEKAKTEAKLRDEFVYVATHELRTPITAIRGFLELVSDVEASFSAEVKSDLGSIKKASDHLNDLVNNLLEIAKSDAGALKTETRPIDAVSIIEGVLNEVGSLIKEKELVLKTNYFSKVANIIADEQKLKEVMMNLISNGIKYNRKGGELEVSVLPETEDGSIMIEVRDTGLGIPEDQQSKIFGKFFRATSKDTQGIIGTGLGLFITKMLVEKMGGQISFSSVSGKGTTFAMVFKKA